MIGTIRYAANSKIVMITKNTQPNDRTTIIANRTKKLMNLPAMS